MHLQESIFCATATASSSAGLGAISIHDIQTGTNLASFKQTNAASHCTAFVETRNAQGGFILAAQPEKSILNFYSFQKLWDLSSQSLLTTFQFPRPISSLAWDLTERIFMAASPDGSIHQINLFRQRDTKKGGQFTEAIGGAGVSDIIRVGEEDREAQKKRLISVGQPITALCISLTSSHLLVGTEAGLIHVYDIPSHQLLRTITTHKGLGITHLATMLKPPDLIGHINLSLSVGSAADAKDIIPVKHVSPFQRMRDPKTREAHEVGLLLPPQNQIEEDEWSYEMNELRRDHAFFVQPSSVSAAPGSDNLTLKSKVEDLEGEVTRLREQLGKAKTVNNVMWDTVVQKTLRQEAASDSIEPDDERRRKRGRT
ncbi:hypothetical protein C0991_012517 [Blastosporella zonata]|nr:hypothetical protein C0991_012517 [Blastosporella zonata]